MTRDEGRASTNLRGRLAEIFLPSLLGDALDPLFVRLGERASVSLPWCAPLVGLAGVKKQLSADATWFAEADARYRHDRTLVGHDRDVAEGHLSMRVGGQIRDFLVAILCVRRPAREVDIRMFVASEALGRKVIAGASSSAESVAVPADVSAHLAAIRFGDANQILETFESEASVLDALGEVHDRKSGALRRFYEEQLPVPEGATTWVPAVRGIADTGRVVAVEYETSGTGRLGLLVLERGESGLFREARIYDSFTRSAS